LREAGEATRRGPGHISRTLAVALLDQPEADRVQGLDRLAVGQVIEVPARGTGVLAARPPGAAAVPAEASLVLVSEALCIVWATDCRVGAAVNQSSAYDQPKWQGYDWLSFARRTQCVRPTLAARVT
jgi:hypothetical protein